MKIWQVQILKTLSHSAMEYNEHMVKSNAKDTQTKYRNKIMLYSA